MQALAYVAVFLTGVLNAIHSGTNATLQHTLERPFWSAVLVCTVSGAIMLAGAAVTREALPSGGSIAATPWWAWAGTAAAAIPVISSLLFARGLGGAAFNGIVVTSTMLASIALDHFGLLGFATHPVNLWRLVGGAFMLGGLALVCLF